MAIIHVESGPNRGAVIHLADGTHTIGRTNESDVILLDSEGPDVHATIVCLPARTVFEDHTQGRASSRAGLPIVGAVELRVGDRLALGETVWVLAAHGADPEAYRDFKDASRVEEPDAPYGSEPPDPEPQRGDDEGSRSGERPSKRLPRVPDGVEIVAESSAMRSVVELALRVAPTRTTVLVCGESGSGKEVIARAIAHNGPRATRPFVSVNAAALSDSLLESELFGHERGAFTGAFAQKLGMFELADTGTLFLDEIGEISPALQAKLLRVLESGELRRVGGTITRRVDVRVISATNRNLRALVREGTFREDLFYRLAVVVLKLPPLRQRAADLEPLCKRILRGLARERGIPVPKLDEPAIAKLRRYPFPGNVRELRNVLERAVIFARRPVIGEADLAIDVRREDGASLEGFPTLEAVERSHIERALRLTNWNKKRAAEILGFDRKTLYAKIAFHRLRPPGDVTDPPDDPAGPTERDADRS